MTKETEDIKAALKADKAPPEPPIPRSSLLRTGSTLLDLACSGRGAGGFAKGTYNWFVGDSDSGKTFLTLTCLAEAAKNHHFDDYRFIFDNIENGAMMAFPKFFGQAMADRLEGVKFGAEGHSVTIEDLYFNIDEALNNDKPCIYVADSMDGLTSEAEQKKFKARRAAARKGKEEEVAGEFTDGKAKKNSSNIRQLIARLKETGSILILISQTRDDFGGMPGFGDNKTHSGGHSLKFYAHMQIWTRRIKELDRTVRGKKRQTGILVGAGVKKNRQTGKKRRITVPIYHSYGIDDLEGCIDYLVEEDYWKDVKGTITADEFKHKGTKAALIKKIEEDGSETELRKLVAGLWAEIEAACEHKRKPRYG